MNETLMLVLAWAAGVGLGAVFFGGLWWTVRKGVSSKQPALWFFGSLLLRMSIALAGFYFVSGGHWERLLLCLLGFVVARFIVTRLTSNLETRMGSARVPRASSGVAPEFLSPAIPGLSSAEKSEGLCFRRRAENHTPEACAPQPLEHHGSPAMEAGHAP